MKQIFMINLIAIAMCLFSCSNSKKQTNADPSAVQAEVEANPHRGWCGKFADEASFQKYV